MVSKTSSVPEPEGLSSLNLQSLPKPAKGKGLWERVEDNRAKLNACVGPHDFQPLPGDDPSFSRKLSCRLCQGSLLRDEVSWYMKGLAHGRSE